MSLRAIQQFLIHIQSFRNIELWYQGVYYLKIQLYMCQSSQQPSSEILSQQKVNKLMKYLQLIYAHPFAHTQNYNSNEEEYKCYDSQIIKSAFIDEATSTFYTKSYLLRYYEEEVELNDICHFRIQTDLQLNQQEQVFVLEVGLGFYQNTIKKADHNHDIDFKLDQENKKSNQIQGKIVKIKKFILNNSKKGFHQFIPLIFDGNYFSVGNATVHSICLDYRFRMSKLQLSQFSKLSTIEKNKLMEKNRKTQSKKVSYYESILKQMQLAVKIQEVVHIEQSVIIQMKKYYESLLKEYTILFSKVITENEKKCYANLLIFPESISLFDDDENNLFKSSFQQKMYSKYKTKAGEELTLKILDECNLISSELMKLWHCFIDLLKMSPRFFTAYYQLSYHHREHQFWNQLNIKTYIPTPHIELSYNEENQHNVLQLKNNRTKIKNLSQVQPLDFIKRVLKYPLLIENIHQKKYFHKLSPIKSEKMKRQGNKQSLNLHLVVLCHGFQGNSNDMKCIKNHISLLYPEAVFLCSTSNEEQTDNDIVDMGYRLASQIKNYIIENFPQNCLGKISFIGHSLGGLIIRAALPKLLDYKTHFCNFITFSSPHLGYKVNTSSVVEAGIWLLQKMKTSHCLKQLTMADNEKPEETCLYKLSQLEGLSDFKSIFLFSSKQDSYAPYESARIEIDPEFMNARDPLKDIHCEMVRNIIGGIQPDHLHRINVIFEIQETNIDSIIGRTAHILFLENQQLMRSFLFTHPNLFS